MKTPPLACEKWAVSDATPPASSDTQAIYRVIISEATRFPDLGHTVYDRAKGPFLERLQEYLRMQTAAGRLAVDNVAGGSQSVPSRCDRPIVLAGTGRTGMRGNQGRRRASRRRGGETHARTVRRLKAAFPLLVSSLQAKFDASVSVDGYCRLKSSTVAHAGLSARACAPRSGRRPWIQYPRSRLLLARKR